MASSRFLLRTNLLSKFCQRTFATEVAVSPAPKLMYYSPIDLERPDTAAELLDKAKRPWTDLSKEDKIAIEEMIKEEPYGKKIIGGVSMLLALSMAFFLFLRKYVSAETPRTVNEEWVKATAEKLKKQRANPITGICSQ